MSSSSTPVAASGRFPRIFYIANALELLERLAFYGVFVNLAVYLTKDVKLSDVETGTLLGYFALGRAWVPVVVGGFADRIGYRTSLLIAFTASTAGYVALYASPTRLFAYASLALLSVGGAFLKPIITGCVKRYSPPEKQAKGFAVFYATVNAGSVVGKTLAKTVRTLATLRATVLSSVVASIAALVGAAFFFFEPAAEAEPEATGVAPGDRPSEVAILPTIAGAICNRWLVAFLLLVSGYYLLIEQFYQTFPLYIVRSFGASAPREYITLINPLAIAVLQVPIARLTRTLAPLTSIALGVLIASASMFAMGALPSLAGACASFFIFALAEMIFSPRYYQYVASFAPKGHEAFYMGLALAPFGVGGLAGGLLSGRLLARYLPEHGAHNPLAVWGTYATIGLACAASLFVYRALASARRPAWSDSS